MTPSEAKPRKFVTTSNGWRCSACKTIVAPIRATAGEVAALHETHECGGSACGGNEGRCKLLFRDEAVWDWHMKYAHPREA